MSKHVRFGPAGNDVLFYKQGYKATLQAPKWLREMGLDALEICFGRGSRMSVETAQKIGQEGRKHNIALSVHAPYFINMANPEAIDKNYRFISQSLGLLHVMGGNRVVIHVGSQGDLSREEAMKNTRTSLVQIIKRLDKDGLGDFLLCLETMGKYRQIGNVEEICDLCSVDPRVIPTLDFGHINCLLQGELSRNPEKIPELMDQITKKIGKEKIQNVHIHWSAIEFSEKGERRHTTLDDPQWHIPFKPLARYIKDKGLTPTIICESEDIMAQDALKLRKIWDKC